MMAYRAGFRGMSALPPAACLGALADVTTTLTPGHRDCQSIRSVAEWHPESRARVTLVTDLEGKLAGDSALTVAEYASLRAEIIKLIELQSQLVSVAVLSVGALLGVAVQQRNAGLAFVYPVLALILGIAWLNHAHAIHRCARYLAQVLEPASGGAVGWE